MKYLVIALALVGAFQVYSKFREFHDAMEIKALTRSTTITEILRGN